MYSESLKPAPGLIYASPVLADGKLYYTSQRNGTYVVPAQPKFAQLAHNTDILHYILRTASLYRVRLSADPVEIVTTLSSLT